MLVLSGGFCGAQARQQPDRPFFYRIEDVRRYFLWGLDLLPTGIDITAGYSGWRLFDSLDTILQVTAGGGYESLKTFRDDDYTPNTPIPADAAAGGERSLEFNSPNFQWELGLRQGLAWSPRLDRNLIEAFLFYRGRYDRYLNGRHYWCTEETRIQAIEAYHEAWQAAYPGTDAYGIFGTSFLLGAAYDTLRRHDKSRAYDGTWIEVSLEASPWFAAVPGATDFWRLNLSTSSFKTLYQARPEVERNVLTIYAGSFFSIDYADARRQMPLYVMQSCGGRKLRDGLAGAVRGFEDSSWDTQLKVVYNFDLRFNLPALGLPRLERELAPGFLLYFDLGYGTGFWGEPGDTPGGFLGSIGWGVYADLFGILSGTACLSLPLIGRRIDGAAWALDLEIGLHF